MSAEGCRDHVTTAESPGQAVVQLDHGEEVGPMHGMYATLDALLEVQRTTKRAESTAILCLFRGITLPPETCAVFFFFWRGLISLCSYSFWCQSNYFLSS